MKRARSKKQALVVGVAVATLVVAAGTTAGADPVPGYSFDPVKLEADMTDCLAYAVGEDYLLMGWVRFTTGETRQWRCSSLRHMMAVDDRRGDPHDPFTDVEAFMRCVDRVVSYGFPSRATDPGNTRWIIQYRGTKRNGNVVVNDATGDIVTIYTKPNNDWAECAYWNP